MSTARKIEDIIWIIADHRPGTYNQAIALAQSLNYKYQIINIKYNIFSKIPNFFLKYFIRYLDKNSYNEIKNIIVNSSYCPKFIISSGRRSAIVGLFLKKYFQQSKIIQIMNPQLNFKKFDLVILPKHDKIFSKKNSNLITTIGSLSRLDENIIKNEQQKFAEFFSKINKKIITVLIGGNSKNNFYEDESLKKLATQISTIAKNMNCHLLLLNSRRTTIHQINIFIKNLDCGYDFFDWHQLKNNNPYLASLGFSDYFIVCGDSISMISECCSTGKPVYIFDEKKISSQKHRLFHQQLYRQNYALKLESNCDRLINYSPKKLQEAKRISAFIVSKF